MSLLDLFWLLLFSSIGMISIWVSSRTLGYWFTPLSIFVGMNSFSMAGYHLRLLKMTEVSFETHLVLLVSLLLFGAGVYLGVQGVSRSEMTNKFPKQDMTNIGMFFYTTAILAAGGWLLATFILTGRYGLGWILGNIWMLQEAFQMKFIGYLNMIGILVLPTYVIRVASGERRNIDLLFVALAIFGLLLAGIKAYMAFSVLSALIVWSVTIPNRFRVKYLAGGMLALLVFFIAYNYRIDIGVIQHLQGQAFFAQFPVLHRPYLYMVGSWPALENIINGSMSDPPVFGTVVLQPMWKILGDGLGIVDPVPFNLPFVQIGAATFNVYSLTGEVFWDFGWVGVVIISLGLGYLSTRLYVAARKPGYWARHLVYGIIGYGLFMSNFFYAYRFNVLIMLTYIYFVAFVICRGGAIVKGPMRDHDN
ncbi:MAG: oligosaccharide repeat unit polymerase [Bacteroidales bacterium]|nr:oligosaccharide repeat unit polymerase [Candidatus Latescibacterota bacterium]